MAIVTHLIADTFGTHIGKYSERLKVTQKQAVLAQAPLLHLEAVSVLSRVVSISADALAACCERGIPVYFVDEIGTPYASLYSAGLVGTVVTRREQVRAYDDERGFVLGVTFAVAKIRNQAQTLRYWARNRKETADGAELLLVAGDVLNYERDLMALCPEPIQQARHTVMGYEGNASQVYWAGIRPLLPSEYGWEKRITRGATDPINSLLNYGYGILYGQVERALVLAGLDPYAGFLHADRSGKPSLVCDLIEEFRQVVVDRVVVGLATRQFEVKQDEKGMLTQETRRAYAEHILSHLEAKVKYAGERHVLRMVIQQQARKLAAFVRGDVQEYVPFKAEA